MRPVLAPAFDIDLRAERAFVVRVADAQPVAALTAAEASLLAVMDGRRTTENLQALAIGALGAARGAQVVTNTLGRLRPLLRDGERRRTTWNLEALSRAKPPDPALGMRRLPGPRVLHWAVTRFCPRRCVYCFVAPEHGGRADDALIERPVLQRVFAEAASLGAEVLLVGGAEPFLRRDLPEVMGDAVAAGLTPLVTTKHPISPGLAHRLAASGIRHISLSVDTMDERECGELVGSRRMPGQVRSSVANLARAGVAFSLQAVVTRLNPAALDRLAGFAAAEGARVLQVVPFEPVRYPITKWTNEDLRLDAGALRELPRTLERLRDRHGGLSIELFEKEGESAAGAFHCDIGQTKMFFLPDGVVHRCYKLTEDDSLCGRDLRRFSVAAAWHDPEFGRVISPPAELYAGTGCGGCSRFASCHDDGRCIYQAVVDRGRYAERDRPCAGPYRTSTPAREATMQS